MVVYYSYPAFAVKPLRAVLMCKRAIAELRPLGGARHLKRTPIKTFSAYTAGQVMMIIPEFIPGTHRYDQSLTTLRFARVDHEEQNIWPIEHTRISWGASSLARW